MIPSGRSVVSRKTKTGTPRGAPLLELHLNQIKSNSYYLQNYENLQHPMVPLTQFVLT